MDTEQIITNEFPFWAGKVRPRLRGLRDYANNISVEIALNALGFVSGVLAARWLGPTGRGQLAAAMLWPGVIGILISLGLQHAFVYAVGVGWAKPERLQRLGLKFTLIVALPVTVIYWLISPALLARQFPNQAWVPRIFALYIPLAVYAGFLLPIYQGSGDFKRWNIARIFRSGAWTISVMTLALIASLTVANLLIVQLFILLAISIYLFVNLTSLKERNEGNGTAPVKLIFRYGFAIYLSGLAYTVNQQLDQLLLTIWVTPKELGQYAAAVTLSGTILFIPSAVGSIGFAKIARTAVQPFEQKRHVRLVFVSTLVTLVPAGLVLMFLASWLTTLLYGSSYPETVALLRILAPASICFGMAMVLADVLRGMGKPMFATYGAIAGSLVTVIGLVVFVPTYGTTAAAWVSFVAYTIMMLVQCFFFWRVTSRSFVPRPVVAMD